MKPKAEGRVGPHEGSGTRIESCKDLLSSLL